jgi:hypothetical protein
MICQVFSRAVVLNASTSVCKALFARLALEWTESNDSDGVVLDEVFGSSSLETIRRYENDDGRVSSSNLE